LTTCGQVALVRAREILESSSRIAPEINAVKGLVTGTVRVGAGPIAAASIVGYSIARLATAHPGLEIHLRVGNWRELTTRLRAEEIDVFVGDLTDANNVEFDIHRYRREDMCWFCRYGHPLVGRRTLAPSDLFEFPVAGPNPPEWAEQWMKRAMPRHDTRRTPMTVKCDDYLLTKVIVLNSDCISAAPRSLLRTEVEAGNLRILEVNGRPMRSEMGVVTMAGRSLAPATEALVRILKESGLEMAPDAEPTMALASKPPTQSAARRPIQRRRVLPSRSSKA